MTSNKARGLGESPGTEISANFAHVSHQKTWLVVSTHLKNMSQNGNLPQIGVKTKNISNHQPETCLENTCTFGKMFWWSVIMMILWNHTVAESPLVEWTLICPKVGCKSTTFFFSQIWWWEMVICHGWKIKQSKTQQIQTSKPTYKG